MGKEGYRWLLRDQTAQSLSSDELPVLAGSEEDRVYLVHDDRALQPFLCTSMMR